MALIASSFVAGHVVDSSAEGVFEVFDPSSGVLRGSHPVGTAGDVEKAVASARNAFDAGAWQDSEPSHKKKMLHKLADLIGQYSPALDRTDAVDMGKPIGLARANAQEAASFMRFCAESVDKCPGETLATGPYSYCAVSFVPRGVVAAVVPWNFPTFNACLKVGPALAAGNSVVLKPSELASGSALRIAQLALEAGLPPGVLNVVVGRGPTAGKYLAEHPDVDMVAFTGSTATGKLMLQYSASSNMKAVVLECGGKSPQIVFADCHNLDEAASVVAVLATMNQGQLCSAGTRLLVEASIQDDFVGRVVREMRQFKAGSAVESTTSFGPLATEKQMERVLSYIRLGTEEHARVVTGGNRFLRETGGYFVEPTLFTNVRPDSRLSQEEIFGPVLVVHAFKTLEEAITLANATKYGLAAYAWTTNVAKTMQLLRRVKAGVVISNAALPRSEGPGPALSIEAHGQSGIGIESGLPGIRSYLRQQLQWVNY